LHASPNSNIVPGNRVGLTVLVPIKSPSPYKIDFTDGAIAVTGSGVNIDIRRADQQSA